MMDCRQIQSKLPGYLDGDLFPAEQRLLGAHLERCMECKAAWLECRAFLQTCDEFLVYPEKAYPFSSLKRRMADIEPIEEVIAFLPKLQINGAIPRFAVAVVLLLLTGALPTSLQGTRDAYAAMRSPFTHHADRLEAAYENDFKKALGEKDFDPPNQTTPGDEIRPA